MNFNINQNNNEYELFNNQTQEMINLYGILLKFFKMKRIENDYIFGESKSLKADNTSIFEFFGLPQETEDWDGEWLLSNSFGIENQKNILFYVSAADIEKIFPEIQTKNSTGFDFIIGNLIMLPNNKLLEITDFIFEVKGGNDLFPYMNNKNVFAINCKPYYANHDDLSDLQTDEFKTEEPEVYESVESLEALFETQEEDNTQVENISKDPVSYNATETEDNSISKAIIQNDPFGELS